MSHDGYKTMKLAIEFEVDVFYHFTSICFETVIDIVQVNARHSADHGVEDTRGKGFRDGVEAWELPSGDEIVSFFQFGEEIGDLFRVVLQVAVHGKYDFAPAATEACDEGGGFAEVPAEANDAYDAGVFIVEFFHFCKGFVGAAIVNEDYFVGFFEVVELCR